MNYILDYLNNLLETKQTNLVFSSFQNIQTQDPLSKLIKCLNTEKRGAIKIKSEEDILIDDFLYTNNSSIIQLNLDHQENVHKNKDDFTVFKTSRRNPSFPTEIQKIILTELKKVIVNEDLKIDIDSDELKNCVRFQEAIDRHYYVMLDKYKVAVEQKEDFMPFGDGVEKDISLKYQLEQRNIFVNQITYKTKLGRNSFLYDTDSFGKLEKGVQ